MANSGGEVRIRPDGRWEGRYMAAGRRRSVYAKTKRECQERLRAALLRVDQGVTPSASRTSVAAYLEEWLATSVATRCRPSTAASYRQVVRLYVEPSIGRIPLVKLEAGDVRRMLVDLTRRGELATTTIRYALTILRIALGRAVKDGRVIRNVATLVDAPARSRREVRPLTGDEVRTFLASVAGDRLEALYVAAVALGLRQGELLGLRWSDVDLDAGTVTVQHTLRLRTRELAEPKTERSRRTLRLGQGVAGALRAHRTRQLEERLAAGNRWRDAGYVFASARGTPLDGVNVTHRFQAALAAAGLPRQRFHDLRHACATLLLENGEELGVVSRILGHADLGTTANVYAHLTPAMLERSAARMDAILSPQKALGS
jgi:integrase